MKQSNVTEPATENKMLYRVEWKSRITGYTAYGDWTPHRNTIEDAVKIANEECGEHFIHWVGEKEKEAM